MKSFIIMLALIAGNVFATANLSTSELTQLKADKDFVLNQEIKKMKDLMTFKSEQESLFVNKSFKNACDDIDIDINIDINDDNDSHAPSPYCQARWSDGTCRTYGSDQDEPTSAYCEARWSDGTCRTYGSDQTGTCYPKCEARWSDGSCRTWGADVCN